MLSRQINGDAVRSLRESRGLSVADLAAAAGCSKWQIYKIEKGRSQPSPQVYAGMKDALAAGDEDLSEVAA
ncbi:helix-turn-helix domain-containing protein [Streptomyces sp. NRRL F-5135]|uniref:helix-turn-helix domain-containing protein n=1 Tax=Streptomyces sp. NRRL F-5135 TaxID=1463858 RepID=UPI0004CAEB15|nr:helix-turn-helix transcriptional regulator [Streptomyces sp. NRRL F-5135]